MNVIIVPGNTESRRSTCLSHRQLALMALCGLVVLPLVLGWVVYRIDAMLSGPLGLDAEVVAAYRAELDAQDAAIAATRTRTETHINALTQRLGQLQAQMWRLNALGNRLTAMADLDAAEFDFSAEPAMGGPAPPPGAPPAAPLLPALETLSAQVAAQRERLRALETLLMNRQLEAAVTPAGWPVRGGWVSSGFGWRVDPFSGRRGIHEGVDIANRLGSPVYAMGDGVVRYAGPKGGFGLFVEIIHGNIVTRYAHNNELVVKVGDRVSRGQLIARVGSSGRSTGPHLHFEVRRNGRAVDPKPYLDRRKRLAARAK
jgi:murein DD-endopeptidase MepM/ murein hydrolase activator NlpD